MLTCIACSKQPQPLNGGGSRSLPQQEDDADAVGTPSTKHAIRALTAQVSDMPLPFSSLLFSSTLIAPRKCPAGGCGDLSITEVRGEGGLFEMRRLCQAPGAKFVQLLNEKIQDLVGVIASGENGKTSSRNRMSIVNGVAKENLIYCCITRAIEPTITNYDG